jgi:hypothetical protein
MEVALMLSKAVCIGLALGSGAAGLLSAVLWLWGRADRWRENMLTWSLAGLVFVGCAVALDVANAVRGWVS